MHHRRAAEIETEVCDVSAGECPSVRPVLSTNPTLVFNLDFDHATAYRWDQDLGAEAVNAATCASIPDWITATARPVHAASASTPVGLRIRPCGPEVVRMVSTPVGASNPSSTTRRTTRLSLQPAE